MFALLIAAALAASPSPEARPCGCPGRRGNAESQAAAPAPAPSFEVAPAPAADQSPAVSPSDTPAASLAPCPTAKIEPTRYHRYQDRATRRAVPIQSHRGRCRDQGGVPEPRALSPRLGHRLRRRARQDGRNARALWSSRPASSSPPTARTFPQRSRAPSTGCSWGRRTTRRWARATFRSWASPRPRTTRFTGGWRPDGRTG
jgi:hypothetical protein